MASALALLMPSFAPLPQELVTHLLLNRRRDTILKQHHSLAAACDKQCNESKLLFELKGRRLELSLGDNSLTDKVFNFVFIGSGGSETAKVWQTKA